MTKLPGERTWDVPNPRTEDVSSSDLDALIERLEARAKCHFSGTCDHYYEDDGELDQEAAAALTALRDAAQRDDLCLQLGKAQSENERLREALEHLWTMGIPEESVPMVRAALGEK